MRIVITGGSGFVGQRIVDFLLAKNHIPIVFSRNPKLTRRQLKAGALKVSGDIGVFDDLKSCFKNCKVDGIIHLASLLKSRCESDPFSAVQVNILGSAYLFEAAVLSGIKRVVFCSSIAAYSSAEYYGKKFVSENDEHLKPVSLYGATKVFSENLASRQENLYQLEIPILRISAVYGPGREERGVTAWISKLVNGAIGGKPVFVPLHPDQKSNFIFVDDVATQLILLTEANSLQHRIYNSGGCPGSPRGVATILKKYFPKLNVEFDSQRSKRPLLYHVDGRRLEREMNIRIKTLEEGLFEHMRQTHSQLLKIGQS